MNSARWWAAVAAIYSVTSAVFLAWESARIGDDWRRLALAHRVLPRDPLARDSMDPGLLQPLIAEEPMALEQAQAFIPG